MEQDHELGKLSNAVASRMEMLRSELMPAGDAGVWNGDVILGRMTDASPGLITAIAATFVLAGVVKGVTGMGLPTVAMGVLGAIMSPASAAALLIVPSFVTNAWQLFAGPDFGGLARRLWPMMFGIVFGTVAAASLLTSKHAQWTASALGAVLMIYAAYTLLARQLAVPARMERWLSPLAGVTTGVVTGGTGVFVIPAVPYLQALGLSKEDLIQALGLSFTISTIALALGLISRAAFEVGNLAMSSLAIAPALFGMWIGQGLRRKISPVIFRRWFLIFLLLLGGDLALRPLYRNLW